jgi:hypothetical protein
VPKLSFALMLPRNINRIFLPGVKFLLALHFSLPSVDALVKINKILMLSNSSRIALNNKEA